MKFSLTGSAPASEMSVSPSSGSLAAGQSVTVTITVPANSTTPPPYDNQLTVDPGGLTITVLYPPSG